MALETADGPVRFNLNSNWERISPFGNHNDDNQLEINDEDDHLPRDPRHWTRDHVLQWLKNVETIHHLPEINPSRFLMNGKALCLMSPSMFLSRVPLGGKLLYKDFQLRLSVAMYARN